MSTVAKLKIHADTETKNRSDLTWSELQEAEVGHSWVSLEYLDPTAVPDTMGSPSKALLRGTGTAMGFWPLVFRGDAYTTAQQARVDAGQTPGAGTSTDSGDAGFSLNPLTWVSGRVEEPDTSHAPKASKEYELTQKDVDSLMVYVNSKRGSTYNLYKYNCTTFAVEAVKAAGKSAPSGSKWGVCLPNALYADLYKMQKAGDAAVTTAPLGTTDSGDAETHE